MQATSPAPRSPMAVTARNLTWFLVVPITAAVIGVVMLFLLVTTYQQYHADRIYTGVMLWGVDLSGMNKAEAKQAVGDAFSYSDEEAIHLVDPATGRQWTYSPADLGVRINVDKTLDAAFAVGRQNGPFQRLREQFSSWYFGRQLAPIVVFDEARLDTALASIEAEIFQPAVDASLAYNGTEVSFDSAQVGRSLDKVDTRSRLMGALDNLNTAEIQLLVHESQPRIHDTGAAAQEIKHIISEPMTLYLQEPLADQDLDPVVVPVDALAGWIRVQTVTDDQEQAASQVFLDENAIRAWLAPYEEKLYRDPVNARFYFDDATQELVLVEPHISGRALDVDGTVAQFVEQVKTPNRSMPFVLQEIVPTVHADAKSTDLGITELVSESTTWFYGSSAERKHNIARSASNFYGIVVGPGEEFSFNEYLGEISEEQGYETGLIIFGGRTIEGVGGGVCQVSTTAFQAAFWAGFPIVERWEHGYRVGYYDDGEGPGMDATVYSPLVDLRFINDTPYHLLIENYYNEANSSLTFKFYSTSLGRTVEKGEPIIENVVPPKPDVWEINEDLEPGDVEQVDWAVEGADVTIGRTVYNANGEIIRQEDFVSRYIPWQNVYQYGPSEDLDIPDGATPPESTEEL